MTQKNQVPVDLLGRQCYKPLSPRVETKIQTWIQINHKAQQQGSRDETSYFIQEQSQP